MVLSISLLSLSVSLETLRKGTETIEQTKRPTHKRSCHVIIGRHGERCHNGAKVPMEQGMFPFFVIMF